MPTIDNYWLDLSDLTIHEAAFWMVIGSDPRAHEKRCAQDGAYADHFHDHPGGSAAIEEQYEVIFSAIRGGLIKASEDVHPQRNGLTTRTHILKTDWINWCRNNGYAELANRFCRIKEVNHSLAANATIAPEIGPSGDDWKSQARTIANECFDHDTNAEPPVRDSLARKNSVGQITGGYCFRVMEIMQQRGIKGPRGIITNPATVMREALQGKKWWADKPK